MNDKNMKEHLRWLEQSKYDFNLAKKLMSTEFSIACFLFQQSAEKIIVSYLVLKGSDKV